MVALEKNQNKQFQEFLIRKGISEGVRKVENRKMTPDYAENMNFAIYNFLH